jgi:hypothetical protein
MTPLLVIVLIAFSCSDELKTIRDPILYAGYVSEQYYEYWFYGDTLIYYNHNRGSIDKLTSLILGDSIYMYAGGEKYLAYRLINKNSDILVLEDNNKIGTFVRIKLPYFVDANQAFERTDSLNLKFLNEAWNRSGFLHEYLTNPLFIENLIKELVEK